MSGTISDTASVFTISIAFPSVSDILHLLPIVSLLFFFVVYLHFA